MIITPKVRIAGPIARRVMNWFDFDGAVVPSGTIYIRDHVYDLALLRHEVAHLGQMRRDGWLYFWFWICVWYVYPGYERSPYEIEAREAENNPQHPLLQGFKI